MSSGFITRVEHDKDEPYTVIFTTDDVEKYEVIQAECRRLIGHAKPMEKLKPCPFCGGALNIWKQQIKPTIGKVAECDTCGVRISIPWALEEFQAEEFLNRRANANERIRT